LKARNRDVHALNYECAAVVPDRIELKSFHDEREIDIQRCAISRTDLSRTRDDSLREPAITRLVQRLALAPELETDTLAGGPAFDQVVGVGREKEVAIFRSEYRARKVA
jgi:hypothetical protein